MFDLRGKELK